MYAFYEHGLDRLWEVITGRKRHREFIALHPTTLVIPEGEVVGIIGRNGAGKSTLLKLIAGTLMPSSGHLERRGKVGAILELGTGFHPDMTGRENVYLSAAIHGLSVAQTRDLYQAIVAFSGLDDFMEQPVKTYSSGMLMRLAFAVATCMEPEILIVDEALSVGDGAFARKSFDRIMAFKEMGKTIIFCSHSLYQVEALCDRVIWLDKGEVVRDGDPAEVVAAYQAFLETGERMAEQDERPLAEERAGCAWIRSVSVEADGVGAPVVDVISGKSEVAITVKFLSDPHLPPVSVGVGFVGESGRLVASAGSRNDGIEIPRRPDGSGEVCIRFPNFPLLKGRYWVNVYLMCEKGIHIYEGARRVAELKVHQEHLERGVVSLPRTWSWEGVSVNRAAL